MTNRQAPMPLYRVLSAAILYVPHALAQSSQSSYYPTGTSGGSPYATAAPQPAYTPPAAPLKPMNLFVLAKTVYNASLTHNGTAPSLYSLKFDGNGLVLEDNRTAADCTEDATGMTYDAVWRTLYCAGSGMVHSYKVDKDGSMAHVDSRKFKGNWNGTLIQNPTLHSRNSEDTMPTIQLAFSTTGGSLPYPQEMRNLMVGNDGVFSRHRKAIGVVKDGVVPSRIYTGPVDTNLFVTVLQTDSVSDGMKLYFPSNDSLPVQDTTAFGKFSDVGIQSAEKMAFTSLSATNETVTFVQGGIGNTTVMPVLLRYDKAMPNASRLTLESWNARPDLKYTIMDTLTHSYKEGNRHVVDMHVSPDDRFLTVLYAGDRFFNGSDSIASFAIQADGMLKPAGRQPVDCLQPEAFSFTKDGRMVVIGCTSTTDDTSSVNIWSRDPTTGTFDGVVKAKFMMPKAANASFVQPLQVAWDE